MSRHDAPWIKAAACHWAFSVCLLVSGCKKTEPPSINKDAELCTVADDRDLLAKDNLSRAKASCRGQRVDDGPILIAHFLEESLKEEICFSDLQSNINGLLSCAPGPYSLEQQISVDGEEKQWRLTAMPDYFVWPLGRESITNEHFYLTNQNGLPIKSQVVKLQNNQESALVLFPKGPMPVGTKFFIYLSLTKKNVERVWIQPIEAVSTAEKMRPKQQGS